MANDYTNLRLTGVDGQLNSDFSLSWLVSPQNHTIASITGEYPNSASGGYGALLFKTLTGGVLSEKLRITPDGNVGIGTSSPKGKLHVSGGDILLDNNQPLRSCDLTGTPRRIIKYTNGNVLEIGSDASHITQLFSQNKLVLADNGQNLSIDAAGSGGHVLLATGPTAGRVGIGTATPEAKLDVMGTSDGTNNGVGLRVQNLQFNTYQGAFITSVGAQPRIYGTMREPNDGSAAFPFNEYGELVFQGGTRSGYNNGFSWVTGSAEIGQLPKPSVKMSLNEQGRLGIGTTAPRAKLHIGTGTGDISEGLRLQGSWTGIPSGPLLRFTNYHSAGTNPSPGEYNLAAIYGADDNSNWGGSLRFQTAPPGTEGGANLVDRMVITSRGNVGIGTSGPGALLHLYSGAPFLKLEASVGTNYVQQDLVNTSGALRLGLEGAAGAGLLRGTSPYAAVFGHTGNHPVQFSTNNQPRVTIRNDGNVGIGTTDPTMKLDVMGPVRSSGGFLYMGSGTGQDAIRIQPGDDLNPEYNVITLGNAAWTAWPFSVRKNGDICGNGTLRIGGSGNSSFTGGVGIGTTSPISMLDIVGRSETKLVVRGMGANEKFLNVFTDEGATGVDFDARGLFFIRKKSENAGGGATPVLAINQSGNVGIGTSLPGALLHLCSGAPCLKLEASVGTNYVQQDFVNTSGALRLGLENAAGAGLLRGTSPYAAVFGHTGNYPVQFLTNNQVRATIRNDGNVGIGTTSPRSALDVIGQVMAASFAGDGSGLTNLSAKNFSPASMPLFAQTAPYGISISGTAAAAAKLSTPVTINGIPFDGTKSISIPIPQPVKQWAEMVVSRPMTTTRTDLSYSSGRVGIGTSSPAVNGLHIGSDMGDGQARLQLDNKNGQTGGLNRWTNRLEMIASDAIGFSLGKENANQIWLSSSEFAVNVDTVIQGKVGIGTAAPAALLHVNKDDYGVMLLGNNDAGGFHITKESTDDSFNIWSGVFGKGTNRLKIRSNGNVGIGTQQPAYRLEVAGGDARIGDLTGRRYLSIASKEWPEIRFTTPTLTDDMRIGMAHAADANYRVAAGDWYVHSPGTDAMGLVVQREGGVSLAPTKGNVGIGTTTPNAKLMVNGSIAGGTSNLDPAADDGKKVNDFGATGPLNGSWGTLIGMNRSAGCRETDFINYGGLGSGMNDGGFRFYVADKSTFEPVMTMMGNGNVGIGTSAPAYKLDVAGTLRTAEEVIIGGSTSGGQISLGATNGTSEGAQINWRGAGSNPSWCTDVCENVFRIFNGSNSTNQVQLFSTGTAPTGLWVQGNVGIGVTNPGSKLAVCGNASIGDVTRDYLPSKCNWNYTLQLNASETSSIGFHDSDNDVGSIRYKGRLFTIGDNDGWGLANVYLPGNVGIGTSAPAYKLDVAGDVCADRFFQRSTAAIKRDITPLAPERALETLMALRPVTFGYRDVADEKLHPGFIAEEMPELVASPDQKAVNALEIVALLTGVVQSLRKEVDFLKAAVALR